MLVLPHVALRDVPWLLFLGICEYKLLLSWQSFPCLCVSPYLIETNPGHTLEYSGVTISDPTNLFLAFFSLFHSPSSSASVISVQMPTDHIRPNMSSWPQSRVGHWTEHPAGSQKRETEPQQCQLSLWHHWNTVSPLWASGIVNTSPDRSNEMFPRFTPNLLAEAAAANLSPAFIPPSWHTYPRSQSWLLVDLCREPEIPESVHCFLHHTLLGASIKESSFVLHFLSWPWALHLSIPLYLLSLQKWASSYHSLQQVN